MNNILLGTRLRELRLSKCYTQDYVSTQLHIARSSYCNYEAGLRTPSLDVLIDLAGFYSITIDSLIGIKHTSAPNCSLTPEEHCLLSTYRALQPKEQREMLFFGYFKKRLAEKHII